MTTSNSARDSESFAGTSRLYLFCLSGLACFVLVTFFLGAVAVSYHSSATLRLRTSHPSAPKTALAQIPTARQRSFSA